MFYSVIEASGEATMNIQRDARFSVLTLFCTALRNFSLVVTVVTVNAAACSCNRQSRSIGEYSH